MFYQWSISPIFLSSHPPTKWGCKKRHIVDTGLALIFQSNLSLNYWPYFFVTLVFLINRLPIETLHLQSPWEILFGTTPTYDSFKTFGCSCYPLLRPYNKHKFDIRSKKCVFLGYASHSKGYICLDTSNNKLIVSRNVIFDESTFPFLTSSPTTPTLDISSPINSWLSSLLYFTTCCCENHDLRVKWALKCDPTDE